MIVLSYSALCPIRNIALATVASVALWGCQSTPDPEVTSTADMAPVSGFLRTAATTSQDSRNYAAAVGYYQSLYTRDPSDIEVVLGLARNLRYIGSAEQSLDILRAATLEHPDRPDLNAEVGKSQLAVGLTEEAIETLREVVKESPEDWQAISALGIAYDQVEEYEKAQAQYRAALEVSPKNVSIINNLALSKALSGDLKEGIEILRRAMAMRNSGTQVRQNLALLYAMSGDMETAERLIKQDLPIEMAEKNIEFYRRTYPGVASDPGAAISEEVSPVQSLVAADDPATVAAEPAAPTEAAPREIGRGIPDVDAAAEPVLLADTDPADPGIEAVEMPVEKRRNIVAAITPDIDTLDSPPGATTSGYGNREDELAAVHTLAGPAPDVESAREPMLYADAGATADEPYTTTNHQIAGADSPDIDAQSMPVSVAFVGHSIGEDDLVVALADTGHATDADAVRAPMFRAGADSEADEAYPGAAPQITVVGEHDNDSMASPVNIEFADHDIREEALAPPAPGDETASDADAGNAPIPYTGPDPTEFDLDVVGTSGDAIDGDTDDEVIGITESTEIMSLADLSVGASEFDVGEFDEATIVGTASPALDAEDARPAAALVMADPRTSDAAAAEMAEAAAPEEMAENMTGTLPAAVGSVLAGFADQMAAPADTAAADTQEQETSSFSYAGNQANDTLTPADRALAGFASSQPDGDGTAETPAKAGEIVVAARSPFPPSPTVDDAKAPAGEPVSDEIMIRLGSFPSLGDATRWLVGLRESHGALLSGVRFQIKSSDDGAANSRYRLIAGPLESEAAAADLCGQLEGFRNDCEIFDPTGDVAKVKDGHAG